jgi:hypothetical protein
MRIFLYRNFQQWAKKEKISVEKLHECVNELEQGLFEANLGGGLYKKRIAKAGQGKRGSYRAILAFQKGNRTFFLYAFAKNKQENISNSEKEIYKQLAALFLNSTDKIMANLITTGELIEV